MTIESDGHAYTFEGYLTQTDIEMEQDPIEVEPAMGWRNYIAGPTRYNISLEIAAHTMERHVL